MYLVETKDLNIAYDILPLKSNRYCSLSHRLQCPNIG